MKRVIAHPCRWLALGPVLFTLVFAGGAAAAAPQPVPGTPGVQQYTEMIPTVTGAKPSSSAPTGGSTGGTATPTPAPTGSSHSGGGAGSAKPPAGGGTGGTKAGKPATGPSSKPTGGTKPGGSVVAAARTPSTGGMSTGLLLAIVLGGLAVCALGVGALARRSRRTRP